ncbi:hypothetical protein DBV05_g8288 [Lasiodiplodia theobromae]|uniref:Uncharacterized protein n=1 Tax=Lasiodiplodia theobromae TaxID=45133 RepID=A0A5N5D6R1_9PEZI|nr:hypothetical protein DBV05_g8288 [Lasiodiplodia theobromae]
MWSNQIDRFWLFNGKQLWRFETDTCTWNEIEDYGPSESNIKRVGGVGINVPSRATGYYLGGYSADDNLTDRRYFHDMIVFHMAKERTSSIILPDYVPIIAPGLAYLDIGAEGMLVVIGGQTEKNGTLAYSSLQVVYFYDIASGSWISQSTTDIHGRTDSFYGAYDIYSPGIPSERYSMCTVVRTAPPHTVFNIYVFGGQNDTATPGDIWALTMPGYVLMCGGCWIEGGNKCLNYGWNPLLYYIIAGDYWMTDWNWHYNPNAAGYNVPKQIFDVVGGDPGPWGNTTVRSPKFTSYNDSLLEQAFMPPSPTLVNHCFIAWEITLPILFGIPVCLFGQSLWARYVRGRRDVFWNDKLKPPSIALLFACTAGLIVVVTSLWLISYLEDPDTSTWTSGSEASGIWTGDEWTTTFTPAAGSGRSIKGLSRLYLDNGESGQWDRHNATQRLGSRAYFIWTYLPSIIFVSYGLFWQVIDGETKRLEKWRQMVRPDGCSADKSLCFDYHEFWSPLALLQALRYRQWAVVFSSVGYLLASIAIPNIQNYVFTWDIFSGNGLAWGGIYTRQVAYADAYWSKVLLAALGLNLACVLGLYWSLRKYPTYHEEPNGIAYIASLTIDDDNSADLQSVFSANGVKKEYRRDRFKLEASGGGTHTRLIRTGRIDVELAHSWTEGLLKAPAHAFMAVPNPHSLAEHVERRFQWPWKKMFDLALLICWNLGLSLTLGATCYILREITSPEQKEAQNYRLPWSPNLYLVVGVSIQSLYQFFERRVRAATVFFALSAREQPPRILYEDWTNTIPFVDIAQAFRHGHVFLVFTLIGTVVSIAYTIMLGSLQVSASFYGATTYTADVDGVIAIVAFNAYLLAISMAALGTYVFKMWKMEWNVRGQTTLATQLAFTLWSNGLREDMKNVVEVKRKEEKLRILEGSRYKFQKVSSAPDDLHGSIEKCQE